MPALEISGVSKAYGALVVMQDMSVSVGAGEALGIIGPNGAGKTTLFNLMTGTTQPDRGHILYFRQDITRHSARQRCRAGMSRSFQIPQPFSHLTTFENVLVAATFGQNISEQAARRRAADALNLTGMTSRANVKAGGLTLLDRKRLELARSIATAPRVLLLDEIAGGLTEAECHELIALIRSIKSEGVTIIWIEHVLHALMSVVDRIMVMDFGRKIAEGDPQEIIASPEVAAIYLGLGTETSNG